MTEPPATRDSVAGPIDATRGAAREVTLVFLGITLASVVISRVGSAPPLSEYVHVAVATLFLWTAVHFAQRDTRGVTWFGLALGGLLVAPDDDAPRRSLAEDVRVALPSMLRELGVALLIAGAIFPPFVLGFSAWHGPTHPFVWTLPSDTASFVLAQILVVSLPEEALFRGYFQTRLSDLFPQTVTLGRVQLPWLSIAVQALLFGLVHLAVDLDVMRLSVLFPGLVFGVLRTWRGGIGAAVFFHALCNVLSDVLVRGWL